MPLQQIVEYFNDRLEWEHHANLRPFFLKDGIVYGLFGPIRIGSELTPIRETRKPSAIKGYAAGLQVTTTEIPHLQNHELELILALPAQQSIYIHSIVDFDRLARTVHMLNFLPLSHEPYFLLLDVDPRHILGVKQDHGAYFQEVIGKCGLEPDNVVITLRVSNAYSVYYLALMKGLENYRQRGYRLALKYDGDALSGPALSLIPTLSPDWVALSAKGLAEAHDGRLLETLQRLQGLTATAGGQSLLLDVEDASAEALARKIGFDFAQGGRIEAALRSEPLPARPEREYAASLGSYA